MNRTKHIQLRVVIAVFVSATVVLAVTGNDYLLLIVGILTGILSWTLIRSKVKIMIDERETAIREKAAHLTYAIFAPTIGIGALLMLIPSHSGLSVFAKGDFVYLESLGMIFTYLTLFLIVVYTISHHFIDRKYGGGKDEE